VTDIYKYRVLKSSWGVAVDLLATSSLGEPGSADAVSIIPGLWIDITAKDCSPSDRASLIRGLRMIADRVKCEGSRLDCDVVITVKKIDYTLTDFQDEGLTCAIIKWSEREFGLTIPDIPVNFNRARNRYEFDFSPLNPAGG
jgi:hypothetical protein